MTVPPGAKIHPATEPLLALAEAMRPGQGWRGPILGALENARAREWTWGRFCATVVRVLCDEDSHPRGLNELFRDPLAPAGKPAHPGVMAEALADMRAAHAAYKATALDAGTGPIPAITEGQS
jgi:hypothetical protein